jgi:hypothetical protein
MKPRLGLRLAFCLAGTAVIARADDPTPVPVKGNVCQADADNLCPEAAKDTLMACLAKNIDRIPEGPCKDRVQRVKDREEAVLNACRNDIINASCQEKDFTTGLIACLKKDAKDVSTDCQEAIAVLGAGGKGRHHHGGGGGNPPNP